MAMSSCPSGHVQVWMNGISIYMPLYQEGKIQQSTLCSQFPTATGLKYKSVDGHWMAVPSDGSGGFIDPHSTKKLFITSKPEEEARQILSCNNLAAEVSKAFGPISNPGAFGATAKFLSSRKDIRNTYKIAKKKGFEKTIKVNFVRDVSLPSFWTKSLLILEGMFSLNSYETESIIEENLAELAQQSTGRSCTQERIIFSFLQW